MTRSQRILAVLERHTRAFDPERMEESLAPLCLPAISAETGVSANNVSMELGKLHRTGGLVRVGGRPVAYLTLRELEGRLGRSLPVNEFRNAREFFAWAGGPAAETPPPPPREGTAQAVRPDTPSRLDELVGAEGSLAKLIRQAKAALTYPPFGLHTLLTGGTGTGKTLFAGCMHDYAVQSGILPPGAGFITFDCAHYSENPQLVLSQLFGYVKGSFTGADRDRAGLVEHADGGVLFLDEIHRLTPEGQEKMFLLMDHGIFRRLGETDTHRSARVLILGATTEDAPQIMLNTFLRRIPVHITLPELEKRTFRERLLLVLYFVWREARNIKARILLGADTLSMLVHYKCPANVGQLASDIKLTCANAYYDYLTGRSSRVEVRPVHLSSRVGEGLFTLSGADGSQMLRQMLRFHDRPLDISGGVDVRQIYAQYVVD